MVERITDDMVEAALDGADYIPNADNRKWMRAALAAALQHQASLPVEAEGWVLVPRVPTLGMLRAGDMGPLGPCCEWDIEQIYAAMLAAAPSTGGK